LDKSKENIDRDDYEKQYTQIVQDNMDSIEFLESIKYYHYLIILGVGYAEDASVGDVLLTYTSPAASLTPLECAEEFYECIASFIFRQTVSEKIITVSEKIIKECPKCHTCKNLEEDIKFCPQCGRPRQKSASHLEEESYEQVAEFILDNFNGTWDQFDWNL